MEVDEAPISPKEEKDPLALDMEAMEDVAKLAPRPRGRTRSLTKKPDKAADIKAKLERSRQSARECRARKKLRYQYLEEIISETEKAIFTLRREMDTLKVWAREMDEGLLPENLVKYRNQCVEKKLTAPFELQQHHHNQIQQQRQNQQEGAASPGGQLSPELSVSPGEGQHYMTLPNRSKSSVSQSISPS